MNNAEYNKNTHAEELTKSYKNLEKRCLNFPMNEKHITYRRTNYNSKSTSNMGERPNKDAELFKGIRSDLHIMKSALDRIDDKFVEYERRLTNIEEQVAYQDHRLDGYNNRIEKLESGPSGSADSTELQTMQGEIENFKQEKRDNYLIFSGDMVKTSIQNSQDLKSTALELLQKVTI